VCVCVPTTQLSNKTLGYMEGVCSALLYSIRAVIGAALSLTHRLTLPDLPSSIVLARLCAYKKGYKVHHERAHKQENHIFWDLHEEDGSFRGVLLQVGQALHPITAMLVGTWGIAALRGISTAIDEIVTLVAEELSTPLTPPQLSSFLAALKPVARSERTVGTLPFEASSDATFNVIHPPLALLVRRGDGDVDYRPLQAALHKAWSAAGALRVRLERAWNVLLLCVALISPNARPAEYSFISRENQRNIAVYDPTYRAVTLDLPLWKHTAKSDDHVERCLDYETAVHLTVWCHLFSAPPNSICIPWDYCAALGEECSRLAGFSVKWSQMRVILPALLDIEKIIPSVQRADKAASRNGPVLASAEAAQEAFSGHSLRVHAKCYLPQAAAVTGADHLSPVLLGATDATRSMQCFIQPLWRQVALLECVEYNARLHHFPNQRVERRAGWIEAVLQRHDLVEEVIAFMTTNMPHLPLAVEGFRSAVEGPGTLHVHIYPCGSGMLNYPHSPRSLHSLTPSIPYCAGKMYMIIAMLVLYLLEWDSASFQPEPLTLCFVPNGCLGEVSSSVLKYNCTSRSTPSTGCPRSPRGCRCFQAAAGQVRQVHQVRGVGETTCAGRHRYALRGRHQFRCPVLGEYALLALVLVGSGRAAQSPPDCLR